MRTTNCIIASVCVVAIIGGMAFLPMMASASETGKRNTTYALGAAAAALLLTQKNKIAGIVTLGGAAYAYEQYAAQIAKRHRLAKEHGYQYQQNGRNVQNSGKNGAYLQQVQYMSKSQKRQHEINLQHDRNVQAQEHQHAMHQHEINLQHDRNVRYDQHQQAMRQHQENLQHNRNVRALRHQHAMRQHEINLQHDRNVRYQQHEQKMRQHQQNLQHDRNEQEQHNRNRDHGNG